MKDMLPILLTHLSLFEQKKITAMMLDIYFFNYIFIYFARKFTRRASKRRRVLFAVVWHEPGVIIRRVLFAAGWREPCIV